LRKRVTRYVVYSKRMTHYHVYDFFLIKHDNFINKQNKI